MQLSQLAPQALVLTPNERLARHLRARDDAEQRHQGAWEPREILSWRSWLKELWDQALPWENSRPLLLRPAQEMALWQQVLEQSPQGAHLLNPRSAARTAAEAWGLLQDYRCQLEPEALFLDEDSLAFAGWAAEFRRRCHEAGWLDPARLEEALEQALPRAELDLPQEILLVGFDELVPSQQGLLEALGRAGCRVESLEPEGQPGTFAWARYPDPEAEACAAARWARDLLERDPGARIGLVVPDLGGVRTLLERVLDDLLCPEAVLPPKARRRRPYNLSLGRAMADRPIVRDALQILRLARGPLSLQEAGTLLRSPHLGGAEAEQGRRGLLDAALRRRFVPEADLDRLLRFARAVDAEGEPRPYACPLLAEHLEKLGSVARPLPARQSPAHWGEAFDALLEAAGWPGQRPLDSEDMQARLRFREVLGELRGLDLVHPGMTFLEALGAVTSLARETIFQPRTAEAPIQVLGFLEAAGLDFDAAWLLGVHDEAWPPAAQPNPYLPLDLQRREGMPHSCANRELEFARSVTRRILLGARQGVASHARSDGDRELRPSALLGHLPEAPPSLGPAETWREGMRRSAHLEEAGDRPPPTLPAGTVARGGTRLFKLQAACPFRAFAELRLGARPLEVVQPGLGPRERGTLAHAVLEATWKALASQQALLEIEPEELAALALRAADEALDRVARERPDVVRGRFRELERERLVRLVLEWLEVERERSPFQVVGFERSLRMEVGGLLVDAQIDRMDRLPDGSLAILDYKTGTPNPQNWRGDRPEEPQLLLYCTGTGEPTGAVLFGQVRPGDMRLKGVSEKPGLHPKVPSLEGSDFLQDAPDWKSLVERWRAVLKALGAQFRQGYAAVDPLRLQTCRNCSLHPLCRVHELRLLEAPSEVPG